ncbi:seryl-tRNA synthetase-like protein [Elsinoe ampelina]|uniref:serine--tRNA ligase n=1 Tax=Elsinoe ampelina TaxID=302913 RepID=A0A6A6GNL9_9PEZI|nr:seryl-tRNA synthetase-like protein [Elsinoe ampelina]
MRPAIHRTGRVLIDSTTVPKLVRKEQRCFARPAFAPKPVLDIKHIRSAPGLYEQNCEDRNYKAQSRHSWDILSLHQEWTQLQRDARQLREKNNAVRRQLANAASSPDSSSKAALLAEAKDYKTQLDVVSTKESDIEQRIETLALQLPNLSSHYTPPGSEPKVLGYIKTHPSSSTRSLSRSHVDIGTSLDLLDFTSSATVSGWGWYYLLNEAVLLENALIQYALSVARRHGWRVVSPPSIVYSHIASACGFMPRDTNGETQIYALQGEQGKDKAGLVLAGTAEIPFAGMNANQTLEEGNLPMKVVGASRCYRAEAGARGVDTKGLYRVHEFTKVEMFAWTKPDRNTSEEGKFFDEDETLDTKSDKTPQEIVFDEMLSIQKEIITSLGLHGRILEMPATDLGASAQRKIDVEVFFPSRRDRDQGWGEVTSLSMCGDYQTRRLATRMRRAGKGSGKLEWPFTVNGTAMAVPRVLAAIMEAGWDEERQALVVPEVLRPWMNGVEVIEKKK